MNNIDLGFKEEKPLTDVVVGFDVSTKCVGITVVDVVGIVRNILTIDLSKIDDMFDKLAECTKYIKELDNVLKEESLNVKYVFIEEPLRAFSAGLSSATTLITLARFNGMFSLVPVSIWATKPIFVNVNTARSSLKIPRGSKKDKKTGKEHALTFARAVLKNEADTYLPLGDWKSYDAADALVIACYGVTALGALVTNKSS